MALVAASQGSNGSIIAATSVDPDAVVSLSTEDALAGVAVARCAARLTPPTLFVTSMQDAYGSTSATRGFYRSCPAKAKRLVVVAGSAHGTALLAEPAVAREVTTFLEQRDR